MSEHSKSSAPGTVVSQIRTWYNVEIDGWGRRRWQGWVWVGRGEKKDQKAYKYQSNFKMQILCLCPVGTKSSVTTFLERA